MLCVYLILTDTDSCSIKLLFVSDIKSNITESKTRKLIFRIIMQSKIGPRIDKSDGFFKQFDCHNLKLKKQVGLYEVESIDNPNVITIAVNPKEYFEVFRNKNSNKKYKGVKRTTQGMDFESYAARIMDLREYGDDAADGAPKKLKQKRFQVKNIHMQMVSIKKVQFAGLNDKRYYFSDGITPLPYGHFLLSGLRDKKREFKEIHKKIDKIKTDLLREEYKACTKCKRIRILRSISAQSPTYYKLECNKRPKKSDVLQTTKA